LRAFDGGELCSAAAGLNLLHERRGSHLTGHHVIRQDLGQLVAIFRLQKILDRSRIELGEGFVRGREDCERPFAGKGIGKLRGLHRGYQRLEIRRGRSRRDDVALG
jgi:hypothetical protein